MDHGALSSRPRDGVDVSPIDALFIAALADALPRIQRVARLLVGTADGADDLVAEAIARTLPKWRSGTVDDAPAYVRRVVVNLASRRWRRLALAHRRDHATLDWMQQPAPFDTVTAERDRTLRAVLRLPPRRRAVVVLRFYDDLPEAAIAQILGIGVGTVKSQLSRALEQLRADIEALDQA
ncbi:MAG: sigma-70 family RNA polymerase sigma factor [Ilumatobacteraceae bacterium]